MLSPRHLRLEKGSNGELVVAPAQTAARALIEKAIQQRVVGVETSVHLSNVSPIHLDSVHGVVHAARVSGIAWHRGAHSLPVVHSQYATTLFLARGDCYLVRLAAQAWSATAFIALDFGIGPKLLTASSPIAQRSPLDSLSPRINGATLLRLVLERELSAVEQYVAAITMPNIWRDLGGHPVPAITAPTPTDVDACFRFCALFHDVPARLNALAQHSPGWAVALEHHSRLGEMHEISPRGNASSVVMPPFATIPIQGKIDKQERTPQAQQPPGDVMASEEIQMPSPPSTPVHNGLKPSAPEPVPPSRTPRPRF